MAGASGGGEQAPETLHVGLAVVAPHGSRIFYGAHHDLVVMVADLIDRVIATNLARPNNGMVKTSGVYVSTTITAVLIPLGAKHSIHVFANDGKWPIFPVYCRAPPNEVKTRTPATAPPHIGQSTRPVAAALEQPVDPTDPTDPPTDHGADETQARRV